MGKNALRLPRGARAHERGMEYAATDQTVYTVEAVRLPDFKPHLRAAAGRLHLGRREWLCDQKAFGALPRAGRGRRGAGDPGGDRGQPGGTADARPARHLGGRAERRAAPHCGNPAQRRYAGHRAAQPCRGDGRKTGIPRQSERDAGRCKRGARKPCTDRGRASRNRAAVHRRGAARRAGGV